MLRLLQALLLCVGVLLAGAASAQQAANPTADLIDPAWTPPPLPQDWTAVNGGHVTVHGHSDDTRLLMDLVAHGDEAMPRLADVLGVATGGPVEVFVAHDADDFRALQPGRPPPWADGTAYPSLGIVFLRHPELRGGQARPLEQVYDHELVHILLGRAFHPQQPPRWLQEGTAQVLAGEAGPELTARLARGFVGSRPIPLEALAGRFPSNPSRADLAYAQTADFIGWMQVTYGADVVQRMVAHARQGWPLSRSIQEITGSTLADVDATWRARLVQQTPVFTEPGQLEAFLFAGGGVLLLLVGGARFWGRRQRMRSWRETDQALDALAREVLRDRQER